MSLQKTLKTRLGRIFDMEVSFDTPHPESTEQDVLFVSIEAARHTLKEKRHLARVTGRVRLFSQSLDAPTGFLSKRIAEADAEDTKCFFFFDLEETETRMLDLVFRTAGFVFFYDVQYNPEAGTINQVNISVQVDE